MTNMVMLLVAIATIESSNDPAAVGDEGKAIGLYQIRQETITDVNRVHSTHYCWPEDARDPYAAAGICARYIIYWCTAQELVDNADAARIWNGGPHGWKKKSTVKYWYKVERELIALREKRTGGK